MPPSPLLATGSKVKTSIDESIPRTLLMEELSFKNDATDVTGVITLNSEYPERF